MPKYVLKSHGYAGGQPGGAEGKFLEWFNPYADGPAGEEMGGWTDNPAKAKTFDSVVEAWNFWRHPRLNRQNVPYHRPDGPLDRPLTAFTVSVEPLDQKGEPSNDGKEEAHGDPGGTPPPHDDDAAATQLLAALRAHWSTGPGDPDQDGLDDE